MPARICFHLEMKGDPLLRNIENDPRYRPFLQKMKLSVD
jgi:hypothetical protein